MTEFPASAPRPQRRQKLEAAEYSGVKVCIRENYAFVFQNLITLFLPIILASFVHAQEFIPQQTHPDDEYTISVDANMVVLHATAQDRKNSLVSGLDKSNFQVYEDEVLQQIQYFSHDDIPVTVGLVIDNSGSMGPKRSDVITAALAFARSSNPQDQMFIVNFNEHVSFALPDSTPFTDCIAQLKVALSRTKADGETALYDAIAVALDHLKEGNRDKKVLIVISDGGDNASKHSLSKTVAMAERSESIIYTIGIFDEQNGDRNPDVLKRFAKNTGGEFFLPRSLKDIPAICERIAHDIRNQYTLTYVPTNRKRDGSYRVIQVKGSSPDRGRLSVRTRAGYFALPSLPSPTVKAIDHEFH